MTRYKNIGGNGGVRSYEIGDDHIIIEFLASPGDYYIYDQNAPGREKVAEMKKLAVKGRGLTTFINQHVRTEYAGKVDKYS